jgi:hypothetical protein
MAYQYRLGVKVTLFGSERRQEKAALVPGRLIFSLRQN